MYKNVLEWLEHTTEIHGDKTAFYDTKEEITFQEVRDRARAIGSFLAGRAKDRKPVMETGYYACGSFPVTQAKDRKPVVVLAQRTVHTPSLFLGVAYAGCSYAPLDSKLPIQRLRKILHTLQPSVILADSANHALADQLAEETGQQQDSSGIAPNGQTDVSSAGQSRQTQDGSDLAPNEQKEVPLAGQSGETQPAVYIAEEIVNYPVCPELLASIRTEMVATDPLYVIFTSGSTGNPKGVITSHQSLMTYIEAYSKVMGIQENDRLGNQSPLDYIAAIRDIYLPLRHGCSTVILPKEYFMEPDNLFRCMNEYGVTAVGWSVSALTVPVSLGAFSEIPLTTLQKICFSGSVMPCTCLRKWQEHLPNARFVNQYGPTEATASCTYYVVDHMVEEDEVLPIGRPYENYRVFLLGENQKEVPAGTEGEICVSGPILALGYYHDLERTEKSFTQNPLNPFYQERIYHTGDIGLFRGDGLLEFHGRKDRQIKHMGHRVELDEIEYAAGQVEGVRESCCLYQKEKEILHLYYSGTASKKDVVLELRKLLPGFMVPRKVLWLEELPRLANGKTDMSELRNRMESEK